MNEYQSLTSPSTPDSSSGGGARLRPPKLLSEGGRAEVGDGLRFPGEFVEAKSAA